MKHIHILMLVAVLSIGFALHAAEYIAKQTFAQMQQQRGQHLPSLLPAELCDEIVQFRTGHTAIEILSEQHKFYWIKSLIHILRASNKYHRRLLSQMVGKILKMKDFQAIAEDPYTVEEIINIMQQAWGCVPGVLLFEEMALDLDVPGAYKWLKGGQK